jgi:hypothetical protein
MNKFLKPKRAALNVVYPVTEKRIPCSQTTNTWAPLNRKTISLVDPKLQFKDLTLSYPNDK